MIKFDISGFITLTTFALLVSATPLVYSQIRGCQSDDYVCFEEKIVEYCRVPETDISTCRAWLEELENSLGQEEINLKLALAAGYYSLYELTSRTGSSIDPTESERYRQISRNYSQEAYEIDSTSKDALYGLAATSRTRDENSEWLRKIIEIDPSEHFAARQISSDLAKKQDSSGYLTAAKLMIATYSEMENSSAKWNVANTALEYLRASGVESEYESFKNELRIQFQFDNLGNSMRENLALYDIESVKNQTINACEPSLIQIFEGEPCYEASILVLELAQKFSESLKIELVDNALDSAKNIFGNVDWNSAEYTSWADDIKIKVRDELLGSGIESASIYAFYEILVRDDSDLSLEASEKAVQLAPGNGQYRLILGQKYLSRNNMNQALEQFEKSRELLPSHLHSIVDSLIAQATSQN